MVFIHVIIDVGVQEFCMLRYRTAAVGTAVPYRTYGTCIQASVEPGSVRGTATAMIEPLPRMLSLFAALLLLGSSGAVQLFVVVSAPRSGTEWLRLMLAGHPRVCCDGEVLLRLGRRAQRPGGLDIRRALDAFARGAAPEYDDVLRCVEIKFTAPSS